jgi:hypothetical protein
MLSVFDRTMSDLLEEMNRVTSLIFIKEDHLIGMFTFQIFENEFMNYKNNISNSLKNIEENNTQATLNSNITFIKGNLDSIRLLPQRVMCIRLDISHICASTG